MTRIALVLDDFIRRQHAALASERFKVIELAKQGVAVSVFVVVANVAAAVDSDLLVLRRELAIDACDDCTLADNVWFTRDMRKNLWVGFHSTDISATVHFQCVAVSPSDPIKGAILDC